MSSEQDSQGGSPLHWFSRCFPATTLGNSDKIRAALMAGLVIFTSSWLVGSDVAGTSLPNLPASIGASTVIVFAMPHSPVARPWPLVGGHFISVGIGILCSQWAVPVWLAAPLACGLAIFAMLITRCLHPPGGATALIPIIGGEALKTTGYQPLLSALALNIGVLLIASLIYQRLLAIKPAASVASPPRPRHWVNTEDLRAALEQMGEFIDVGERELGEIFQLATARAFRREFGEITAGHVMTPEPFSVEFGSELEEAWTLMQTHRIKALPVVDRGRHVIGIVTQSDFFRHARTGSYRGLGGKFKQLLRPSTKTTSDKPEVVGQIMSAPVLMAGQSQPLAELARLLTERGIHQLPVVDSRNKLVGMITQTDLVAALYQNMTRHFETRLD